MVFTYICGDLQWSATGSSSSAAVVGYSSAGRQYLNHRLSGYRSIEDSLSCAVRLGRRKKRQSGLNNNDDNTIMFNVQNVISQCQSMIRIDELRYGNLFQNSQSDLERCPCTKSQAMEDSARFRRQRDVNCYVSMKRVILTISDPLGATEVSLYQQCCYDENGG